MIRARPDVNKNKRLGSSPALDLLKTVGLVALSFSFGVTFTISTQVLEPQRSMSVTENVGYNTVNSPQSKVARGMISREQRDVMRAERQLRSAGNTPSPGMQRLANFHDQQQERQSQFSYPVSVDGASQHSQQYQVQIDKPKGRRTPQDLQYCRDHVFTAQLPPQSDTVIDRTCNDPITKRFDVCTDLVDFTGLSMEEVRVRLARIHQFHFEEEHLFWNPQTNSELAWYYSTSQSYLFANAVHGARQVALDHLQPIVHEPILDYSGGVGNSLLYLTLERGMTQCQYFGIGMMEKSFAQFRVAKRGLQDKISFLSPWSEKTLWTFDPLEGPLPRDGSLGSILATDVLEHIPEYHRVVQAMVDSLKIGGVIIEVTPFAETPVGGDKQADTRIHVHHGGITMKEAMGERMVYREAQAYWEKIKA